MRRISGVDINGWHDVAARNWNPDEPEQASIVPMLVDGGVGGVVGRQEEGSWIGGPQAALAPHGRGRGWGILGDPARRVRLADVCDELVLGSHAHNFEAYAATVDSLARGAHSVILTVPDHSQFDESAQGRVLSLFRTGRRSHRLLWRSVALFLDALERGLISHNAEGSLFRLLIHSGAGIEEQKLRLRADKDHPGHVAPERDGYGRLILPEVGLQVLQERANAIVVKANRSLDDQNREESQLSLRVLCGKAAPGETEILRRDNGTWMEVTAPKVATEDVFPAGIVATTEHETATERISGTFLATPLGEPFAASLQSILQARYGQLQRLDWHSIARGAQRAGQLVERGLPHYFDKLTPISLAVLKRDQPLFEDLVGTDATLPANREYVSPVYEGLVWGRGKTEIDFFVLKGSNEVRHWRATHDSPPARDVKVELRLRQTPGQSWAKLSMTSPDWEPLQRNPIFLDWDTINAIDQTPDEVLESLKTPPPSIPERIVELPLLEFWTGSEGLLGLLPALEQMQTDGRLKPHRIAELLCRFTRDPVTRERFRPVGTDGQLPEQLSSQERRAFDSAMETLSEAITAVIERRKPPLKDNDTIRAITWAFTLCPGNVQDGIVSALAADIKGQGHSLLAPKFARRVLTQAAGRAVAGRERVRGILEILSRRETNTDTLSALAMILSRRQEAPSALTNDLVERIVALLAAELVNLKSSGSFKTRFKNALSALAGLFRYREVEPYALISGRDPVAQHVRETLTKIDAQLKLHARANPHFEEMRVMIASLQDHLDGRGDPNILKRIDDLDSEDEE